MGRLSKLNFDKVHPGAPHPSNNPNHLWAKAMDSLVATLASNREFLNLTWGNRKTVGRYRYIDQLALHMGLLSGVSHEPAANTRKKDGNLNWPGFSPEMRGLTCMRPAARWDRGPGRRVLKKKELAACPVVALHGTMPSPHPGPPVL